MQEFYGVKTVREASGKVLIAVKPALCLSDIRKAGVLHAAHGLHYIKREPDVYSTRQQSREQKFPNFHLIAHVAKVMRLSLHPASQCCIFCSS